MWFGYALRVRLTAFLAPVLFALVFAAGCGRETGEFERIAQPARFALVRDTAQWTPGFDPSWWTAIDAAYSAYDGEAERIVRTRWNALAREASAADQSANPPEPGAATAWRARQRAIDAELAAAERDFIARIDSELPPAADRFIALLSARIECARATAVWAGYTRPVPGPLEVLARVGVHEGDDALCAAAIDGYGRIAREAPRLSEQRYAGYIAWTEDFGALDEALAAARERARAETGKPEGARVEVAQEAFEARILAMREVRAETTESLRIALLSVGDAFAAFISDEAVRAEFLERLEADLHEGMSTTRSMAMYGRLAERAIRAAHLGDEARLEAFRAELERGLALQRERRAQLRSADEGVRREAYRELSQMPGRILASAGDRLGQQLAGRLFWAAVLVDLGHTDEDAAVEGIFAEDARDIVDEGPADADQSLVEAIGSAQQLAFLGTALSPRVLRELSQGLALDDAKQAELDALVVRETDALAAALRAEAARIAAALRGLDRGEGGWPDDAARRHGVDAVMRVIRASAASTLSLHRAANARALEEAARLGGIARDHPALVEATIELELLAHIGSRGLGQAAGRRELEGFAGVTVECYSNPFAVARLMEASDADRAAALALIAARSDELVASAQATRAAMLDNLRGFLDALVRGQRRSMLGEPPWRPALASREAVELRFALVEDLAQVLAPQVALAYERCWRALEQPGLRTPRLPAIGRVEKLLDEGAVDPVGEAALRAALAASNAARDEAVRAAHRWRATTIVREGMESAEQWRDRSFDEPLGVLLFGRIDDADQRALALLDAIAASTGTTVRVSDATRIRERPIPQVFRPIFRQTEPR
jgi:hypothetical protein